jgi:hypothetical protein
MPDFYDTVRMNADVRVPKFPGVELSVDGKSFRISDADQFMGGIVTTYKNNITPEVYWGIADRITDPTLEWFLVQKGIPGLHAEVFTWNDFQTEANVRGITLNSLTIFTGYTYNPTYPGTAGNPFIACPNCSGIIPPSFYIATGRGPTDFGTLAPAGRAPFQFRNATSGHKRHGRASGG